MLTIFLDAILIPLETQPHLKAPTRQLFPGHRRAVLGCLRPPEFLLKVYVEPVRLWKSWNNVCDAALLFVSFPPHTSSTVESLGVIKVSSSSPLVNAPFMALYRALKSVMDVLCLIFMSCHASSSW